MSTTARSTATSSVCGASSAPSTPISMESKPCMASATGSVRNRVRRFRPWHGQWTIAHRILALNLLILVVFAVSVLYLDAFRNQLQDERSDRLGREAQLIAGALSTTPTTRREALLAKLSADGRTRARLYGPDGTRL